MLRRLIIAAVACATLAPAHAAEFTPAATCAVDMPAVDASFEETQARLAKVTKEDHAELCAAVQHHVEVMANGINVYQKCLPPGHDKGENIAQLVGTIADFLEINEAQGCPQFEIPEVDLTGVQ
jgi:hypothetical protein